MWKDSDIVREVTLITMSLFCTSCTYHERWQDSDIVTGPLCMKAVRPPGRPRVQCCDDATLHGKKQQEHTFFQFNLSFYKSISLSFFGFVLKKICAEASVKNELELCKQKLLRS